MTPVTTPARLLEFLRAHQVLTLAVVEATGAPHAAALFYAVDEQLGLYVLSDPATRHGRAMLAGGLVAGTVQADDQHWRRIQGVQFHGRCRRLAGVERRDGWRIYCKKFPFLRAAGLVLRRELKKMELWRIEPDWMRLIDNRGGFGRKREFHR